MSSKHLILTILLTSCALDSSPGPSGKVTNDEVCSSRVEREQAKAQLQPAIDHFQSELAQLMECLENAGYVIATTELDDPRDSKLEDQVESLRNDSQLLAKTLSRTDRTGGPKGIASRLRGDFLVLRSALNATNGSQRACGTALDKAALSNLLCSYHRVLESLIEHPWPEGAVRGVQRHVDMEARASGGGGC